MNIKNILVFFSFHFNVELSFNSVLTRWVWFTTSILPSTSSLYGRCMRGGIETWALARAHKIQLDRTSWEMANGIQITIILKWKRRQTHSFVHTIHIARKQQCSEQQREPQYWNFVMCNRCSVRYAFTMPSHHHHHHHQLSAMAK